MEKQDKPANNDGTTNFDRSLPHIVLVRHLGMLGPFYFFVVTLFMKILSFFGSLFGSQRLLQVLVRLP